MTESFTAEELQGLSKADLMELAEFYGVHLDKGWKKDDMIKVLYNTVVGKPEEQKEEISEQEEVEIPMSVRIRRIYESQKENF